MSALCRRVIGDLIQNGSNINWGMFTQRFHQYIGGNRGLSYLLRMITRTVISHTPHTVQVNQRTLLEQTGLTEKLWYGIGYIHDSGSISIKEPAALMLSTLILSAPSERLMSDSYAQLFGPPIPYTQDESNAMFLDHAIWRSHKEDTLHDSGDEDDVENLSGSEYDDDSTDDNTICIICNKLIGTAHRCVSCRNLVCGQCIMLRNLCVECYEPSDVE